MNPTTPCSSASMLPNCSPPDPKIFNTTRLEVETDRSHADLNIFNTIRSEMETDSSLDIFGSLPDILSISYFKQASPTTGFSPISCNEESSVSSKRKFTGTNDIGGDLRRNKHSRNFKRTRSADMHNICERRRRDKIRDKMKGLQELIPHSHKEEDKASMLGHAIDYLKALKLQVEMLSNMLRGTACLCQAPWVSAAPTVCLCSMMLMNPAPKMGMLSACQYGDVPMVHLRNPFMPPLLGGPTSTPRPIAPSDQGESTTSREQ